jgi:hypothetical protein
MLSVLRPVKVTDAVLVSSTVVENDHPAWVSSTAYAIGDRVIRTQTHRIYEALIAGTDATAPENAPTRWLDIGPTNRWAAFDEVVGTRTSATATPTNISMGTPPLSFVLQPGQRFDTLALMDVSARFVQILVTVGGSNIFYQGFDLSQFDQPIMSYTDYLFGRVIQKNNFWLPDLPGYTADATITVDLYGTDVHVGVVKVGRLLDVGFPKRDFSVGRTLYAIKDETGGTSRFIKSPRRRQASGAVEVAADLADRVITAVDNLGDDLVVMSITREHDFTVLLGQITRFQVLLKYPKTYLCNLEFEALI